MSKYFSKLGKKLAQAIKTLIWVEERNLSELICEEITKKFIVVHFGVGTESDYEGVLSFLEGIGLNKEHINLDIYPGYPHGFLQFT